MLSITKIKSYIKISLEIILVFCLYVTQHRLWIFRNLYSALGSLTGSNEDIYYNISLYFQNSLNFIQGTLFSLNGDHYTWYNGIIGLTGHGIAPSFVFILLYEATKNPLLSYNILYFGNILLFQLGLYLLIRYYTKNRYIAFIGGFLFPLSLATKIYYTQHIHAMVYWTLPFLILLIELYFDNLKSKKPIFDKKQFIILIFIFLSYAWLLLSDWHIAIFSSLYLTIFSITKIKIIKDSFIKEKLLISSFVFSLFLAFCTLIPIALQTLHSAQIFHTERSIYDVAYEAKPTNKILFFAIPLQTIASEIDNNINLNISQNQKNVLFAPLYASNMLTGYYPDLLTSIMVWFSIVFIIPLSLYSLKNKYVFSKEIILMITLLFFIIIAMGPFLKIDQTYITQIKLPYYYIYKAIYPLQAIRNIPRAFTLAYFATIVLFSLVANRIYLLLKKNIFWHKGYNYLLFISLFVLSIIVNNGWYGLAYTPEVTIDEKLQEVFTIIKESGNNKSYVYFLNEVGKNYYMENFYGYNVSYFNYQTRYRYINSVNAGIAGYYPKSTVIDTLEDSPIQQDQQDVAMIMSAKEVNFIIIKNRTPDSGLIQELKKYYDYNSINTEYALMNLKNKVNEGITYKPSFDFIIPKTINKNQPLNLYINFNNLTDDIYINDQIIDTTHFEFRYINKDGEISLRKSLKFGEEPFLLKNNGKSVDFTHNVQSLKDGPYTVELLRNGIKISEKQVNIVNSSDWQNIIKEEESNKIELSEIKIKQPTYRTTTNNFTKNSVYITGIVSNGIINPENKKYGKNSNLVLSFYNLENQAYQYPEWLVQPNCSLHSTYLKGDEISIWCDITIPLDPSFKEIRLSVINTPKQ